MLQHIILNDGTAVDYIDHKENVCSAKCQPRDIEIVTGPNTGKAKEEIAIDIRLGQGVDQIGVARGLKS